jgi:hypothetical protein
MTWLYGKTGVSLFDGWFIIHTAFWMVIGGNARAFQLKHNWAFAVALAGSLVFAYVWEFIETFLQKHTDIVLHHEGWLNRYVSDPLIAMPIGFFLGYWAIKYLAE